MTREGAFGNGRRPPLFTYLNIMRRLSVFGVTVALSGLLLLSACDTTISGTLLDNRPPTTQLSVRDTSLVGKIEDADRLASTVYVSWSGTDPDGYVVSYDLRYYQEFEQPGPEELWVNTTRNDTIVLLPIPRGEATANVVFEVRAIDNDGLKDPNPARTVFPIKNSPPTLQMVQADSPSDTTFTVMSFGWRADDPEGEHTIDRIEISLNDTTSFVSLPGETRFITLIANTEPGDGRTTTDARVYLGRSFQSTNITVPGLRLGAENIFYARSVDQTDTTSTRQQHEWFVRKPTSDILVVNDWRRASTTNVMPFHLDFLRNVLARGFDVWDLSLPYATGATVIPVRSAEMPTIPDPTLKQTLVQFRYIYWVTSASTNSAQGNNLPFAASVMDEFFAQGGRLMVNSPVTRPQDPEDNLGNPAVLLLPLTDLVVLPDSLLRLELPSGWNVEPVNQLPGVSGELPRLRVGQQFINEMPYIATGTNIIPLYEGEYRYLTRQGQRGPWPGPRTVASISADRRIGLFGLPLVRESTGEPVILTEDGDPEGGRRALRMMLESLGFPLR
jgi:hypothetical protein